MAAKTRAERRERRKVSARRRVEGHKKDSGSRYLRLPEGINFFKVDKAGSRLIDVMPYIMKTNGRYADKGEPYWEKTFWIHRNVGSNNDTVICPNKSAGKKCPICEHRAAMTNNVDSDESELKELAPKERQVFLVRDLKDVERGLQVWDMSPHLFGNLLESRIENADEDEEDDWDSFADLEQGSTLRLTFSEKTFGGNAKPFYEVSSIDLKSRKVQYKDSDIDEHPCLDDLLVIKDYDDLKKLFLMVDADDDSDEDDDDDPKPKRRRQKPVMVDDEDDDVDDNDTDDDDEEELPPPKSKAANKKSTKKSTPPPDDDDDDDEPWDDDVIDDDNDPPPAKATKAKTAKASKKTSPPPDEDDDDDWGDEDEEEEEKQPSKKTAKSKPPAAKSTKKKPAKEDEDWDDDWD